MTFLRSDSGHDWMSSVEGHRWRRSASVQAVFQEALLGNNPPIDSYCIICKVGFVGHEVT